MNKSALILLSIYLLNFAYSSSTFAALVDIKQANNIIYALNSAPNKIIRYDLSSESFLDEVSLSKIPTSFHVTDETAYIGFNRELVALDLATEIETPIRNFSTTVNQITQIGDYLQIVESSRNVSSINTSSNTIVDSYVSFYSGTSFVSSNTQNAYYYRTTGISPSDIRKVSINSDGSKNTDIDSPYHGAYPSANKLYINGSENKIYDDKGIIYFALDLTYAGSLAGNVEAMTFNGDNPIILRENKLTLFNSSNIEQGSIDITGDINYIAYSNDKVYLFTYSSSSLSVSTEDTSSFTLPQAGDPVDPTSLIYDPEIYDFDGQDVIYLLDKESLSIFRWSKATGDYLETLPLINPANWMTYSKSHNRLYLGYSNGKISYFDLGLATPVEQSFINMAFAVQGLLATGDYLFAVDQAGAWHSHYSIDENGIIIDSAEWRSPSNQYAWNSTTNRVYHYRSGTSPNDLEWAELNPVTGELGADGDSPYHGSTLITSYPILVVENDQLILNGAGQLIDANSLNILNSLSNNISAGITLNDQLITVNENATLLQLWDNNYLIDEEFPLASTSEASIFGFEVENEIVITQLTPSGMKFSAYDLGNLPDTDTDGIHDLIDNCINTPNANQADFDNDSQGDVCDEDDDNDRIPDAIENAVGLNPRDATDALLDLDLDTYNNLTEYLSGSDIDSPASVPTPITSLNEDFESGIPSYFSYPDTGHAWTLHTPGQNSSTSLKSSFITDTDGESDITIQGYFAKGIVSFSYASVGEYYFRYSLSVLIDGVQSGFNYSGSNLEYNWRSISVELEEGYHEITLKVSTGFLTGLETETFFVIDNLNFGSDEDLDGIIDAIDNCPTIPNPSQIDSDNDDIGNECDTDPFNQDADSDGYGDTFDNCPNVYNPDQRNQDFDQYGDLCDDDSDNDSIKDEIENLYAFLDPLDSSDALEDFDGDGVANLYEINSNEDPSIATIYTPIDLFSYYPLGEISYVYEDLIGSGSLSTTISPAEVPGQFYLTDPFNNKRLLEKREDGIYLLEISIPDGSRAEFNDLNIFPSSLKLGESLIISYSVKFFSETNELIFEETTEISYQLVSTNQQSWNSKTYKSIQLLINNFFVETYLEGVGHYSNGSIKLLSADIKEIPAEIPVTTEDSSSGGGGGSTSLITFILFILLYIRKKYLVKY